LVVGAGASALDVAALLHEAGARVQLIARAKEIRFHDPPQTRSLLDSLRAPLTGLGSGWRLVFITKAPFWFHRLPTSLRLKIVKKALGPAPGWFVKEQAVGKFPFHLGINIVRAAERGKRVIIEIADGAGTRRTVEGDHVIAATGYRVNLERLAFLDQDLLKEIQCLERSPVLSQSFESTVPGLYFIGTAAANSFGPLMRFAYGADFAARKVSKHLRRTVPRKRFSENIAQREPRFKGPAEKNEVLTETIPTSTI
jgi:pyruvate/2-oxoglutarate dehydrogenase complex dihydrolipoamide dehydrogenase (E3) component